MPNDAATSTCVRSEDSASSSEANLELSLEHGKWGWKRRSGSYSSLQPGDGFAFVTGYSGGSPRTQPDKFLKHDVARVIVGRTTTAVYEDDHPFWPDESVELGYPIRVDFEILEQHGTTPTAELDELFGGPVADAIRRSGTNQGRAELVNVSKPIAVQPRPFDEVVHSFIEATKSAGLSFGTAHDTLVRSFVTSLATKPFVILTGLSGSGKTRLAKAFGDWLGASRVIAVRPDWTSPDSLLGFENALSDPKEGRYAWNAPETLRFILQARDHPHQPHLLLLDEMNLAHVERYFADVLSGMESAEAVVPDLLVDDGVYRARSVAAGLIPLPKNLFVVGTVNIDETTYMFSPKVLDRANTFEFRVETGDLDVLTRPSDLSRADAGLAAGFLATANSNPGIEDRDFAEWLRRVHELLSASDREFGHRTFQEALRFAALIRVAGEPDPLVALDLQISQKVLPRLHGSRRELTELLNELGAFCFVGPTGSRLADFDASIITADADSPVLPRSFSKLHRMAKKLRDNHFVSYAE